MTARIRLTGMIAAALILAACAGSTAATDADGAAETQPTQAPTTTQALPATTAPSTAPPTTAAPTTTVPPEPAMEIDGNQVTVNWDALGATPFYAPAAGGPDPHFLIHTNPDTDGFFLSFEMYTTGWGQQWTGETGTFDISCHDAVESTGICPYFDPDGPGPEPVKGDDFATTGSVTIVQLDDGGYEIVVHELVFSDGTTFEEFTIQG